MIQEKLSKDGNKIMPVTYIHQRMGRLDYIFEGSENREDNPKNVITLMYKRRLSEWTKYVDKYGDERQRDELPVDIDVIKHPNEMVEIRFLYVYPAWGGQIFRNKINKQLKEWFYPRGEK